MANYVLVHGAWGSGHYEQLRDDLQAAGHRVLIAQLRGMATRRAELSPAITLSDHVSDVMAQVEQAGIDRFVLVGHSYGGMVITGVATNLGARIDALVYLDAFVPENGEALWDLASDFERKHYIDAQRDAPGLVAPLPFIQDPERQRHPLLTLTEPVRMTGEEAKIPLRCYVYATRGAPQTFGKFRDRAACEPGWKLVELEGGHFIHLDQYAQVRDLLLRLAE